MIDPTVHRARRIARPDVLLRGEEAGVGPTVLLLHAGGERRQVWTPVIDVLYRFKTDIDTVTCGLAG